MFRPVCTRADLWVSVDLQLLEESVVDLALVALPGLAKDQFKEAVLGYLLGDVEQELEALIVLLPEPSCEGLADRGQDLHLRVVEHQQVTFAQAVGQRRICPIHQQSACIHVQKLSR